MSLSLSLSLSPAAHLAARASGIETARDTVPRHKRAVVLRSHRVEPEGCLETRVHLLFLVRFLRRPKFYATTAGAGVRTTGGEGGHAGRGGGRGVFTRVSTFVLLPRSRHAGSGGLEPRGGGGGHGEDKKGAGGGLQTPRYEPSVVFERRMHLVLERQIKTRTLKPTACNN